jgi:ankyrin repeat protein
LTTVTFLLSLPESGYDTCNLSGDSALSVAVSGGEIEIVELLLDHGAKIDVRCAGGQTPIVSACMSGDAPMVAMLLLRGADTSIQDDDGSSLLYSTIDNGGGAAESNRVEIVKLLLKHGVDVNVTTNDNNSPLHAAIQKADVQVVQLLLSHGADIDAINDDDENPLSIALTLASLQIADVVRAATSRRVSCEAFAMGKQDRLGVKSQVSCLVPEVLRMVLDFV